MTFNTLNIEEWRALANAQLKNGTIEDYTQTILNQVQVSPYYTDQKWSEHSQFESHPQYLSAVRFQNPFAEKYIGEIKDYLKTLCTQGAVEVQSIKECIEIENNFDADEFEYWIDLFHAFETTNNTPIELEKEFASYDTLSDDVVAKMRFVINVSLHQNAGAATTFQLALALAKLNELVTYFSPKILSQVIVKLAIGSEFLQEISKVRALRRIGFSFCENFGLKELPFQIFIQPTGINLCRVDEENNLIRMSLELASGILGGADWVYNLPYSKEKNPDWMDDVALKQSLIASKESLLDFYHDAMAGSYLIEHMTEKIAEQSWKEFQEIEKNQGYIAHFDSIQNQIHEDLTQYIQRINDKKVEIVGYNVFESTPFHSIDPPKKSNGLQPFVLPQ